MFTKVFRNSKNTNQQGQAAKIVFRRLTYLVICSIPTACLELEQTTTQVNRRKIVLTNDQTR